ncbi:MAG TPA: hypothetical protein VEU47_15120 [Candidatus Cybelea sp.]|nr:hypothetical protein [Candidatus Cybelea sp.]
MANTRSLARSFAIGLVASPFILSVAACALPAGDQATMNEMLLTAAEVGRPKARPVEVAGPDCAEAVKVANRHDSTQRADFSRCPSRIGTLANNAK